MAPRAPEAPGQVGGNKSSSGDSVKWERKMPTVIEVTQILTTHVGVTNAHALSSYINLSRQI